MIILIKIIYFSIALSYFIYSFKKDFISPSLIFILSQSFMFFGISILADPNVISDVILLIIYISSFIFFAIGNELCRMIFPLNIKHNIIINKLYNYQRERIWLIVTLSILLSLYLYYSAGTNVFITSIKSLLSDDNIINSTEDRLSIYKVSGIGYIYQFRVILLPILTLYIVSFMTGIAKFSGFIIFPFMIVFLLGTGQRAGFVIFILVWLTVIIIQSHINNKKLDIKFYLAVTIGLALFIVMTLANGRVTSNHSSFVGAVLDRFVKDNQKTAIIGFRYIYEQPIQWGKDWMFVLKDLLPGKSDYVQVANRIFQLMYGTTRGTSPPDIWGSVYHNFGYIGLIFVPFIMGFLYRYIYFKFYKYPITSIRLIIYTAIFVMLGFWIADSPIYLFNQGVIALLILSYILHIDKSSLNNKEEI